MRITKGTLDAFIRQEKAVIRTSIEIIKDAYENYKSIKTDRKKRIAIARKNIKLGRQDYKKYNNK